MAVHPSQALNFGILMSTATPRKQLVERRGELMAELFLEELEPAYLARPSVASHELGFDYFVGFKNPHGGVNTFGVVTKATEQPVHGKTRLKTPAFNFVANSNLPVLLLVTDVKRNQIFIAWPREIERPPSSATEVAIPLTPVDEAVRSDLKRKMAA